MTIALDVYYCKICSIPPEFCKYSPFADKCKKALAKDNPDLYSKLYEKKIDLLADEVSKKLNLTTEATFSSSDSSVVATADATVVVEGTLVEESAEETEKKRQSRGGKGLLRDESVKLDKEAQKRANARITIKRVSRNKRKAVTHLRGFELFGLDLKKVAKKLAGKYACGSSVVKDNNGFDEIDVQGDFVDDLVIYIPKEFPEIKKSQIEVIEK